MIKFYIIIVGNDSEENSGSIARAMGNFGFNSLIFVSPVWNNLKKAEITAHTKIGIRIIQKSKKYETLDEVIKKLKLNLTLGFSRRAGKAREISANYRNYFKDFFEIQRFSKTRIGLVFGREESGLSEDEISLCNNIIYIPSTNDSPSLNLSHAVSIILNELFFHLNKNKSFFSNLVLDIEKIFTPSTVIDRENFYNEIIKISKRKKLFIKNDEVTFKRMFERIFSSPVISKKDLKLLKRLLVRFLYADKIDD
jgi:tRNA/rRNA methyltransferase